eukprot:CAMPEP_0119183592 /NCGR_PEP_ID=MMETSP1315-20130426/64501_1 /TAXON_ID=676789 /ORGANISM="Prasinoderma singularis, Strain RCC927" /LENGTH=176 /DNA_ID=CAMNT_0007177973 /DNA_START=126 /DNA_END=654 /DNA_ORIENTATION=+
MLGLLEALEAAGLCEDVGAHGARVAADLHQPSLGAARLGDLAAAAERDGRAAALPRLGVLGRERRGIGDRPLWRRVVVRADDDVRARAARRVHPPVGAVAVLRAAAQVVVVLRAAPHADLHAIDGGVAPVGQPWRDLAALGPFFFFGPRGCLGGGASPTPSSCARRATASLTVPLH